MDDDHNQYDGEIPEGEGEDYDDMNGEGYDEEEKGGEDGNPPPGDGNQGGNPEDDDDDFPEYANEKNKQLNQIVKQKKKLINEIATNIEEKSSRLGVLKDHLKNVQNELVHTQALVDQKNKEIETEDHLKQITERQIGRIERELQRMDQNGLEKQERLNDIQNQIFKGNERMDQHKLEMNWNQEELEQWALAARQKEEDNLTLEKYKRADEVKIKEMNLEIERETIKVNRKQQELEREITETQAAQIELDKTAEEFKRQHEERHKLYEQWDEALQNIRRREEDITNEGERFAAIKLEIKANTQLISERKDILQKEKLANKNKEVEISINERLIVQQRASNKQSEEQLRNLDADVGILKNQLSAFSSELASKRTRFSVLSQDLLQKKQRLNNAQKRYGSNKVKLENELSEAERLEQDNTVAEARFADSEKRRKDLEKEMRIKKELLFKCTQDLFKYREDEANLYSEIQGSKAACRHLESHIAKLNQEFQRQQELLYNAEYQIQLMERKVARAKGVRTLEETRDINREIEIAQKELEAKQTEFKQLTSSVKRQDDELRAIERQLAKSDADKKALVELIEKLTLENDMTSQALTKIIKMKEEVLVQHDCMKLEIKKIRDELNKQSDTVLTLENKKYQLEMSMQEREKEINVHRDVLVAEEKAAEEERHKIAVELAERKNKVKNLKIKYEGLVQKNKASDGDMETVNEHSQAYYIIKAAQEREELQRKADELNAKIIKSEKELKALDNTLNHLRNRNSKYRDSFVNKGVTVNDLEEKSKVEEQTRAASENLFKKKKDLQTAQKEYEEDVRRLNEISQKIDVLRSREQELMTAIDRYEKEIAEQYEKMERANKTAQQRERQVRLEELGEQNPHVLQLRYDNEVNKNKTLVAALQTLMTEFPEFAAAFEGTLKDNDIRVPSKAPSSIDVASVASRRSGR
jgi:hypothetical protein